MKAQPPKKKRLWLLCAIALLCLLIVFKGIPLLFVDNHGQDHYVCRVILGLLDDAAHRWCLETKKQEGYQPTAADQLAILKHIDGTGTPQCPGGGQYSFKPVGKNGECKAQCSIPLHNIQYVIDLKPR